MARFAIVPGLTFASRSEWGPKEMYPRLGRKVARSNRTHVFIHHTCGMDKDETPNIWESEDEIFATMRHLQTCRPDLGFDVPYNFIAFMMEADRGLYICEGRGEDRDGAHTKGHNTRAIAVSFAGNFQEALDDPVEIAHRMPLLSYFLGWLKHEASHPDYGQFKPMSKLGSLRPSGRKVFFHRDVKNTACPGIYLEKQLTQVDFIAP